MSDMRTPDELTDRGIPFAMMVLTSTLGATESGNMDALRTTVDMVLEDPEFLETVQQGISPKQWLAFLLSGFTLSMAHRSRDDITEIAVDAEGNADLASSDPMTVKVVSFQGDNTLKFAPRSLVGSMMASYLLLSARHLAEGEDAPAHVKLAVDRFFAVPENDDLYFSYYCVCLNTLSFMIPRSEALGISMGDYLRRYALAMTTDVEGVAL